MKTYTLKQKLGVLLYDWLPFEWRLRTNPAAIRNRAERLEAAPQGDGIRCCWQWTSDVHACKVIPALGRRLMNRSFARWPIDLGDAPPVATEPPLVSFIIGHRGMARLPHLLMTLSSIAAQEEVSFECIVVEQSAVPEVKGALPAWVRYRHTPLPNPAMPYSRSWTFNIGARMARGTLLILHDNDMLLPRRYTAEMVRHFTAGYEVINLKRFIFYLGAGETTRLFATKKFDRTYRTGVVVQNLEAGGSLAVGRRTYLELGGFDEAFIGWGGEDNEFWERAVTRKHWPYTYLPILHLWHEPQPGKLEKERETIDLFAKRSGIPVSGRIAELAARNFGSLEQLDPPYTGG